MILPNFKCLLLSIFAVSRVLAFSRLDIALCIDEQTTGKTNIASSTSDSSKYGTDFASDGWQTYLAPVSALYSLPLSNTSVVRKLSRQSSGKYSDPVSGKTVQYSCVENDQSVDGAIMVTRTIRIPQESVGLAAAGILGLNYFIENPVQGFMEGRSDALAAGAEVLKGVQHVHFSFFDHKGALIFSSFDVDPDGNPNAYPFTTGALNGGAKIPEGSTTMQIAVVSNGTSTYCIGKFSVFVYKFAVEHYGTVQRLVNASFIISLVLIVLVPVILMTEQYRRRGRASLKMLDLVHVQGSRLIRAMFFILSVSFLYKTYEWLIAKPDSSLSILPIFGGISSEKLSSTTASKILQTPVFVLCFVIIGLIFWPIGLCYAQINEGSRIAAVLGLVATLNMVTLRTGIQYLQHSPLDSVSRAISYQLVEIFAYFAITVYFMLSSIQPGRLENFVRKTNFRNAVHVMGLLRKVDTPQIRSEDLENDRPIGFIGKIKELIHGKDVRPIWIRGREYHEESIGSKIRTRLLKAPTRLVASIFMMTVFTYVHFVTFLSRTYLDVPKISCVLGIASFSITNAFSIASNVMQEVVQTNLFGESMTDALSELMNMGNPVALISRMIQISAIFACLITFAILIFNIVDLSFEFHRDLERLRKGNYSFMTITERKQVSSDGASQFMGVQVGFAFVGTVYTLGFIHLFCFLLAGLFESPYLRAFLWRLLLQNGFLVVAALVSFIFAVIQRYIINRFFVAHYEATEPLQKKVYHISTRFWLVNLNKYNHIDYFFLFPNLIRGILSFLGNILTGVLGSAIYSYRVDKRGLIPIFSTRHVYLSWLLQEHHHHNPVLMVAIQLLRKSIKDPSQPNSLEVLTASLNSRNSAYSYVPLIDDKSSTYSSSFSCTTRPRTKWFLVYTLIKNPSLVSYRKHRVQETLLAEWISENEAVRIRAEVLKSYEGNAERTLMDTRRKMREVEVEEWKAAKLAKNGRRKNLPELFRSTPATQASPDVQKRSLKHSLRTQINPIMLVSHSKPDTLDNSVLISFLQSQYPTQFPPSESVAVTHLAGERDLTLLASVSPNAKFIVKVATSSESVAQIELQAAALSAASKHTDLKVGGVVPTKDGLLTANLTYPSTGAVHVTHVLEFVEGRMWADIKRQSNPQLLASLGDALAQFDAAFKNVDLKSHSVALKRELKWDLMHAAWIGDNFRALEFVAGALDCAKIDLVRSALDQFNTTTLPALRALPHQLIYNDANDNNIVVAKGAHKVASFIDFGDICVAPTICNLAVAIAYAAMNKGNPLRIAVHIIQGYVARQPLPESSIPLLYNLVQMRLAVSVTVSAINRLENPNDAYLTISEKPAWELLAKWNKIHPSLAHATFREAAGLSAVPSAVRVTKWIQSAKPHPILSVAPSTKFVTLDLSMGSTLFAEPKDWTDISRFNKIVADTLDQAGGSNVVGVGRYSEPRCIYYGDAYKRQTEEGPEWRTVHLGIDLFVAAGHKVFAPFDATIFSVTDNDNPLDYGPTVILESQTSEGDKFWTLYGHLDPEVLTRLTVGSTIKAGDLVAHIGAEDRNGGWPPHLHFQVIADSLDARERGDFPGVAFPAEIAVWSALSPDPTSFAGLSGLSTDITVFPDYLAEARELLQIRREKVGYNLSISYDVPLHIVRGFRQYLFDVTGRAFLDAVNNVPNVGHSHPTVVKAAHLQNNLLNTNTRYLHPNMIRLSQKLTATLPAPLSVCYFVNSGSEANELAIRMARAATGKPGAVVVDIGYHGNTTSTIDLSPYKHNAKGGRGPPSWVEQLPLPDPFRGMYRGAETGEKYASHIHEAIKTLKDRGEPMGMFIAESILGCGGQIVLPDGYLKKIYEVVRAEGGVCVADEVQVGFARVGSHFWGFETQGVVPDIVTMGKPFGNGHPLAAVVTTPEIAAAFNNGMEYFNTFGGNPVSCAIGLATLQVIHDENLQENAFKVGNHLLAGLERVKNAFPKYGGDARGLGLYVGLELVKRKEDGEMIPCEKEASYVANRLKELGILISTDGPDHNVLKIKPPICFSMEDADRLVEALMQVFPELEDVF